jgi:hypothetical protein
MRIREKIDNALAGTIPGLNRRVNGTMATHQDIIAAGIQ